MIRAGFRLKKGAVMKCESISSQHLLFLLQFKLNEQGVMVAYTAMFFHEGGINVYDIEFVMSLQIVADNDIVENLIVALIVISVAVT